MAKRGVQRGNAIGRQLHHEGRLVRAEHEAAQHPRRKHRYDAAEDVDAEQHRARALRKEGARQQDEYGQSRAARHERIYQYGYQSAAAALDGSGRHYRGNVAAEAHDQRNERLAVKPRQVHELIHDERGASHVPRILHQRYEQIKYQNVWQEHRHGSHAADDSVHYKVAQRAVGHDSAHRAAQPRKSALDPLLRIGAERKGAPEHEEHHGKEQRKSDVFVRYDAVDK